MTIPSGIIGDGWMICTFCPPDDCEWPTSAFAAYLKHRESRSLAAPICNACFFENLAESFRPCACCGAAIHHEAGRGRGRPPRLCPVCRRSFKSTCPKCRERLDGREQIDGHHTGCYRQLVKPAEVHHAAA